MTAEFAEEPATRAGKISVSELALMAGSYSGYSRLSGSLRFALRVVVRRTGSDSARFTSTRFVARVLPGVVENYAEGAAVACGDAADAVAHVDAIPAAGALHRPVVHREDRRIAFHQGQNLRA